jgi:hypothetical protein
MNGSGPTYYYPNQMGRIVLLAMEEVIGRNSVNAVLNLASLPQWINNYPPGNRALQVPFEMIGRLQSALEKAYGPRAGHGIALRTGRACFRHGLREFGPLVGLTDLAFRLLPLPAKLNVGSRSFADVFNKYSDQRVSIEQDRERIYWNIDRCPVCWGRSSDAPACHLAIGVLQEALYWASGGKFFNVEEMQCVAQGDSCCKIVIDKTPMS